MHVENLRGNHIASEMTPQTVALLHGLKTVFAPHPVWFDRPWNGHTLSVPMLGHPFTDEAKVKADFDKLQQLIDDHDAIFLLMDSRESRWLPSVMGKAAGKIVMNAALGFDSFVVMRHGAEPKDVDPSDKERKTLGCYFCNDVVAPVDSQKNLTLDQQCTVTRPGVAAIASAQLVELLASLLQHPLKHHAAAPQISAGAHTPRDPPDHALGLVPHQIRGFVSTFENLVIRGESPSTAGNGSSTINLANEFGVGNPYHSPSDSASSGYSTFSRPGHSSSQSSSQTSPVRSRPERRKPSDTSNFNNIMIDLEVSMADMGSMQQNAPSNDRKANSSFNRQPSLGDVRYDPAAQGRPERTRSPLAAGPNDYNRAPVETHIRQQASSPPRDLLPQPSTRKPSDPAVQSSRGNCKSCGDPIKGKSISSADGRLTGRYHKACFVCTTCTEPFTSAEFYVHNDKPYCEQHYHKLNGSLCGSCGRGIEGQYLEDEESIKYHVGCFRCGDCGMSLSNGYFEVDGRAFCERDAWKRVQQPDGPPRGMARSPAEYPPPQGVSKQEVRSEHPIDEEQRKEARASEQASAHDKRGTTTDSEPEPKVEQRTAVLLRSYTGKKYTENDKQVMRALISELNLRTGGEYQVYLLLHAKAPQAAEALKRIYPGVESEGHTLSVPMLGHPFTDEAKVKADFDKLQQLIDDHDAIFLLMDSRESRWLPSVMGKAAGKIVMNAALGFDSFVVMRHGAEPKDVDPSDQERKTLGCYFCNDVVAPVDSQKNLTLDQQCTVTRPGVAAMASAQLVELLASLLQHPLKHHAAAPQISAGAHTPRDPPDHALGLVPHQIRGFVTEYPPPQGVSKQEVRSEHPIDEEQRKEARASEQASAHDNRGTTTDSEPEPKVEQRTAVLLRSYTGKKYTENDKQVMRALISELNLPGGGDLVFDVCWALSRSRSLRPVCNVHFRSAFSTSSPFLRASDPLRILFCGSDEFSIAALRALHHEHLRDPSLIESLDVVIRPGKPTGRGLKTVRQVPIKSTAQELGLPIHEINTFTGWTPSFNMNLIVAVSFGLLVPPRLLRSAQYGGLNLHPSLLPDLRGPAPLHHTLLLNRPFTGITLQTLHESKFDHGTILSQTSLPGIPVPPGTSLQALHDIVTPPAADMLVQGLRDGVHVPPLKPVGWTPSQRDLATLRHAPKLTKQDRQVRWRAWAADDFAGRETVLGPLWSELQTRRGRKRVIFEGLEAVAPSAGGVEAMKGQAGAFVAFETGTDAGGSGGPISSEAVEVSYLEADDGSGSVLISAPGGGIVKVARIKIEGDKSKPAANTLAIHTNVGKAEYWRGYSTGHGDASS
ncbi:hypothetical protein BN1723_012892 [Verticillium longisporum]|uniref:methionyl-tRNA formyltransferase n=1 Tax=Verticillium longisporum TaxID=100787 RepID=A0A0G4LM17_VERLO|nr:hypothetical protein BN1723_012892 [Verticillium longisporum]